MVLSSISAAFSSARPSSPNMSLEVSSISIRSTLTACSVLLCSRDAFLCCALVPESSGALVLLNWSWVESVYLVEVVGFVCAESSRKEVRSLAEGRSVVEGHALAWQQH